MSDGPSRAQGDEEAAPGARAGSDGVGARGLSEGPPHGGMPRWVKVFVILLVAAALAFLVSLLAGVRHGPGLHSVPGGAAGAGAPAAATAAGR